MSLKTRPNYVRNDFREIILVVMPTIIGLIIASSLYLALGWWGFWIIFPWIGFAISMGIYIQTKLTSERVSLGRRVALILIFPILLLFVPVFNNENFQLEGIVLLLSIGFFSKGVIHYAVAKVFGPLIWGRGFCGWACWTAAVLEWLPIKKEGRIRPGLKKMRYVSLGISIVFPLILVFFLNYDVRAEYLNRSEMVWMFLGNGIYYLIGIPLAFILKDRRAFCKVACPVSLVMKLPSRLRLIKIGPSGKGCIKCGKCNQKCPMDIDVMFNISQGKQVIDTECILCGECGRVCPVGAIK
ncbi:MAG: 4Fe-4S binding protein [Bacteroidota bacterium]